MWSKAYWYFYVEFFLFCFSINDIASQFTLHSGLIMYIKLKALTLCSSQVTGFRGQKKASIDRFWF